MTLPSSDDLAEEDFRRNFQALVNKHIEYMRGAGLESHESELLAYVAAWGADFDLTALSDEALELIGAFFDILQNKCPVCGVEIGTKPWNCPEAHGETAMKQLADLMPWKYGVKENE